jgi:hypothetical protein
MTFEIRSHLRASSPEADIRPNSANTQRVVRITSDFGTKRTWRDVRFTSAIGGQADIKVALGMIDDFTI